MAPASAPAPAKQGSHGRLRRQGGCSGARVEHPFLRKSCFLHRRGAHFQNITFPGPVEKGHKDVVNHMPWRTATRHCVHSVMPSCMTPSVVSNALAQRQLVWHAVKGRAGPRRGAFIPFGVRAAASPFFQIMFRGPDYADENIL